MQTSPDYLAFIATKICSILYDKGINIPYEDKVYVLDLAKEIFEQTEKRKSIPALTKEN
jgi:hypothetical protein